MPAVLDASGPAELPREALAFAEHALDRAGAEESVLHDLPYRLDGRAESVEGVLEPEPRVEAEHPSLGLDHLAHAPSLADRARHGLLAPDVLAGLRGHHALYAVPVRRRADVDDVHAGVVDELDEVPVRLDASPSRLLRRGEPGGHARRVAVGESDQPRSLERKVVRAVRDLAESDQRARELVGRGLGPPKHLRGDDVERTDRRGGLQELSSCCSVHFLTVLFS